MKNEGRTHTWDLHIKYHRCPACGYIVESRENYTYKAGVYEKELKCPRCKKSWKETGPYQLRFGPLIGKEIPKAEVDWE